jgi:transposase
MAPRAAHDMATRAQVVALKALGIPNKEISRQTGVGPRTINTIYDRAIGRGFNPNAEQPVIRDTHVQTAPRSGRPSKQTEEIKKRDSG